MSKEIPYKIYLEEHEMPKQWYNVRADMKNKPAPLLNPGTKQPMTLEELEHVFCTELAKQELDDTTPYIDIPEEILNFYKMYRPSPLVRAYCLEKKLGTPAKIYYKFEGNNTSGSHKLNSAIAQAYYAKYANDLPEQAASGKMIFKYYLENSILVRDFTSHPVLTGALRITVGLPEENKQILAKLTELVVAVQGGKA